MSNFIKRLFNKDGETEAEALRLSFDGIISFKLTLSDLLVGTLTAVDGHWTFEYSDAFKQQSTYARLTGFSDLNKVYESKELWPFFKIRIPGLKQPMIRDILDREGLSRSDDAALLRRFGRRTMSNPYILEPSR